MAFKTLLFSLTAAIAFQAVVAQDPTSPAAATHTVIVGGNNALTYEPSNVAAAAGDTILFRFESKNHTVTRSTFANPCDAVEADAFGSGFRPVAGAAPETLEYTLLVNNTEPVWAYCAQGNHCQQGMVFSINAPTTGDQTFEAFQEAARASDSDDEPASPSGSSGSPSGSSPSGSAPPSQSSEPAGDDGAASSLVAGSGLATAMALFGFFAL